jgi:hypothetical protein
MVTRIPTRDKAKIRVNLEKIASPRLAGLPSSRAKSRRAAEGLDVLLASISLSLNSFRRGTHALRLANEVYNALSIDLTCYQGLAVIVH